MNADTQHLFDQTILFIAGYGTVVFIFSLFLTAPFGKFYTNNWSWSIKVPGKPGWLFFESIPWIVYPLSFFAQTDTPSTPALLLLFLWQAHYLHRSLIYTYFAPSMAPMSLLITVGGAVVFNVANGFVNGTAAALTDEKRLFEWQFWIGVIVFAVGMSINVSADYHLFSLRQQKADGDKPKQRYFIPRKGMFVYVSAANYFGEILEWAGYAIASGNIAPCFCSSQWRISFLADYLNTDGIERCLAMRIQGHGKPSFPSFSE